MQRAYNFGAGPAMLPDAILKKVRDELFDWQGTGVSVMEIGHRTAIYENLVSNLENKIRQVMSIPENYQILFLPGGGKGHFSAIPMNLTQYNKETDYFITGIWSKFAADYAKKYCNVNIVTQATETAIPAPENWQLNKKAAYAYYCPNETINGIGFPTIPEVGDVPLIADMTSYILSQPFDVSKFGIIFAAAQKNLGIAGITLLIVRDDLLNQALDVVPDVWDYKMQAKQHSGLNTPPTFAIYMMDLMINWFIEQGGIETISQINKRKAEKLYNCIDQSNNFYSNSIDKDYRSKVNIPFNINNKSLLDLFFKEANDVGLKYLTGHMLVGGARASIYNAMPEAGVDKLVDFMNQFANKHSG